MVTVAVRYQYDVDLGHYELPCLTMINPEETIQKTNNAKGQQTDLKCLVNLVVNHVVMDEEAIPTIIQVNHNETYLFMLKEKLTLDMDDGDCHEFTF